MLLLVFVMLVLQPIEVILNPPQDAMFYYPEKGESVSMLRGYYYSTCVTKHYSVGQRLFRNNIRSRSRYPDGQSYMRK